MQEPITKLGQEPGPVSTVLVGVHGNEPCGIRALEDLLPELEVRSGTVHFIVGNPRAVQEGVRFTQRNLNRMFQDDSAYPEEVKHSYEFVRSREIMKYLDQSSALLDIHSAARPTQPFAFSEHDGVRYLRTFPRQFVRVLTNADQVEPGGTDGYMYRNGKVGICIECGQHDDPNAIDIAKESILAFLEKRGHVPATDREVHDIQLYKMSHGHVATTDSFVLDRQFEDFEHVTKGTLIGSDAGIPVVAPMDALILFARNLPPIGSEAFLLAIPEGDS